MTGDAFTGTWQDEETRAFLTVSVVGDVLINLFVQDDDGEVWPVTTASFDKEAQLLLFTAVAPSTGYVVTHTLAIGSKGSRLVGSFSQEEGVGTAGGATWKRVSTALPGAVAAALEAAKKTFATPARAHRVPGWLLFSSLFATSAAILWAASREDVSL